MREKISLHCRNNVVGEEEECCCLWNDNHLYRKKMANVENREKENAKYYVEKCIEEEMSERYPSHVVFFMDISFFLYRSISMKKNARYFFLDLL